MSNVTTAKVPTPKPQAAKPVLPDDVVELPSGKKLQVSLSDDKLYCTIELVGKDDLLYWCRVFADGAKRLEAKSRGPGSAKK